ncbi:PspC domain-containing protein [Planomonospora algeriensis]
MNDTGSPQDPASTSPDSPSAATAAGSAVGEGTDGERRLRRDDEGRMLTGVCSGLGHHAGVDPVLFRAASPCWCSPRASGSCSTSRPSC